MLRTNMRLLVLLVLALRAGRVELDDGGHLLRPHSLSARRTRPKAVVRHP
eukprot:COSAG01_NODE_49232_length_374_cov_0.563636_2_plen_49_part_01